MFYIYQHVFFFTELVHDFIPGELIICLEIEGWRRRELLQQERKKQEKLFSLFNFEDKI